MSRTRRICFVITGLDLGGAETMLLKLLRQGALREGATVVPLVSGGALTPAFEALGVPVRPIGMKRGVPDPIAFWRLCRELRGSRAEVVSTWMYHADLLGGLAAKFVGRPVVWGIRNSDLSPEHSSEMTRLVVRVCAWLSHRVPAAIICNSERARAIHQAAGYCAERMRVIPNGFDLEAFKPDPAARAAVRGELGWPHDAPLVGMVARADPQKDHAGFAVAAGLLRARGSAARFVLIGPGVDAANPGLAAALAAAGIADRTALLGPRADLPRLTAAFDVAVLSSAWGEAFPNVIGEALACGVPVVATDVGDVREIVGEAGRVVPPGQPAALAEAIAALLALTPEQRRELGALGRARMSAYGIDAVAGSFRSTFDEVA